MSVNNLLATLFRTSFILFCPALVAMAATGQDSSCVGGESTTVQLESGSFSVHKVRHAVLFRAGMQIDADGAPNAYGPNNSGLDHIANARHDGKFVGIVTGPNGKPVIQKSGRFRGFYVSPTSLHAAGGNEARPGSYVDARKIPYIVLPAALARQFGVALGDLAFVVNERNGKSSFAIYADTGPADKIGEGSIALARALDVNADPRHGGIQEAVITYLVFPGSGLGQGKLRTARNIRLSGRRAFRRWGGPRRLKACRPRI